MSSSFSAVQDRMEAGIRTNNSSFLQQQQQQQAFHDLNASCSPFDMNEVTSFPATKASCLPSSERGQSPSKQKHDSSSPLRVILGDTPNIAIPPPPPPAFATDSLIKKPTAPAYQSIAPQPPAGALFTTFPSLGNQNKENLRPAYHSDNFAEFSGPGSGSDSVPMKGHERVPSEIGYTDERKDNKKRRPEPVAEPVHVPEPDEMPGLVDNGQKPPYSYATLIGMAVLRAPNRRLTLAQIYKWISDTFAFYRATDAGWQNSIRHNLSLHKAFIKKERPKDDPGKGNYWAIEPGMEGTFMPGAGRDKSVRRPASTTGGPRPAPQAASDMTDPSSSTGLPPPLPSIGGPAVESEVRWTKTLELSSDATIPASDPALLEEEEEDMTMPPPRAQEPLSSPLQTMRSSPPLARQRPLSRENTPSLGAELPSDADRSRGNRKRKLNSMNDSGYFSSLESSAVRPGHTRPLSSGAMDHKGEPPSNCFKRGRAEEEIARLRSSSHDISPTKAKANATALQPPTQQPLMSSSPLRPTTADSQGAARSDFNSLMLPPPLTPAITLKRRRLAPPPSVSPNTNLRNHRNTIRELIGSPLKHDGSTPSGLSFSPAFNLADESFDMDDENDHASAFHIFMDSADNSPVALRRTIRSSEKNRRPAPAAKRSGLGRFSTATSPNEILADITSASTNGAGSDNTIKLAPNPALKPPMLGSPLRYRSSPGRSPSKALLSATTASIFGDTEEDFFGSLDLFTSVGDDVENDGTEFLNLKRVWDLSDEENQEKENAGPERKKKVGSSATEKPALGIRRETARSWKPLTLA